MSLSSKSYTIKQLASPGRCRGYSVTFVHQPPREVETECPICCDVLFQPKVVTCCGISFCAGCIGLVERDGKPCPHCRGSFISYDDKKLRRTLNGYKVFCPHKEKGCKWIGELSQCDVHLDQSGLLTLFHEVYCHLCQTKCERRLMPDHLSSDCPHRDVECRYHIVGCEFKKPLQEMEDHLRESIDSHLLLTAKSIVRIRNDLKNEAKKQQKKQLAEVNRLKELQESQLDVVHNMLEKQRERQLVETNELKRQQERQLDELKLQERKLAEANKRQVDEFVKQQQQQVTMQEQFTDLKRKHGRLERKNRIIAGCLALTVIAFVIAGIVNQMQSITELSLLQAEIELALLNRIKTMESHCGNAKTAVSSTNDHRDTVNNGRMESSSDLQLLPTVTVYSDVLENIPSLTDTGVDVEADRNLERKKSVYTDLDSEIAQSHTDTQRSKDTIPTNNHYAEVDTNDLLAEDLLHSNSTAVVVNKAAVEEINLRESHVDLELSDQLDSQIKKVIHAHVDFHVDMKNACSVKDYFVDHMLMGTSSGVCRVSDNSGYADKGTKSRRSKVNVIDLNSDMTMDSHVCKARDMSINNDVEWTLSSDDQKEDSGIKKEHSDIKKVSHADQVPVINNQMKFSHIDRGTKPLNSKREGFRTERELHSKWKPSRIQQKTRDSKAKVTHTVRKKKVRSTKGTPEKESRGLLKVLKDYGWIILATCACLYVNAACYSNQDRNVHVDYRRAMQELIDKYDVNH